jgi:hypothetical protein
MQGSSVSTQNAETSMAAARARKPIYLYCAIGEGDEFRPIERSAIAQARIRVGRVLDDVMWRVGKRWRFEFWRYEDHSFTNVGDIAIREACIELTRRAVPGANAIRTVSWGGLDEAKVEEINREASAFIIAGSGYFIFDEHWRLGKRVDIDLPGISELRVPKIMLGVGVNNPAIRELPTDPVPIDADAAARLGKFLPMFELVTVRDNLSQRVLQPFTDRSVRTIPDPALFLGSLRASKRAAHTPPAPEAPLRVGLNLALHGPYSEALLRRNLPTFIEAFRTYQRESGCEYVYFQHSEAEWKIADLLSQGGVTLRKVGGGPDELILQYRGLSFHVCQMLHSSILAMSTDCPTVGIAYDLKSHGFFEMMGLPENCLSAEGVAAQAILNVMRRVGSGRDHLRQHIGARRGELFAVMQDALTRMDAVIEARAA